MNGTKDSTLLMAISTTFDYSCINHHGRIRVLSVFLKPTKVDQYTLKHARSNSNKMIISWVGCKKNINEWDPRAKLLHLLCVRVEDRSDGCRPILYGDEVLILLLPNYRIHLIELRNILVCGTTHGGTRKGPRAFHDAGCWGSAVASMDAFRIFDESLVRMMPCRLPCVSEGVTRCSRYTLG